MAVAATIRSTLLALTHFMLRGMFMFTTVPRAGMVAHGAA